MSAGMAENRLKVQVNSTDKTGKNGILRGLVGKWVQDLGKNLGMAPATQNCHAVPICSFGPGGSYLVDWQVNIESDFPRRGQARTLAAGIERFAEVLTLDLKGWLLAEHPDRQHRVDSHPATLDACPLCGHENQWPDWFRLGHTAPDNAALHAGLELAKDLRQEMKDDPIMAAMVEAATVEAAVAERCTERSTESNKAEKDKTKQQPDQRMDTKPDTQHKIERNDVERTDTALRPSLTESEEVINYSDGSWDTENAGPFLFKFSDNLEPVSFRLPSGTREHTHDADTQTAQNTHRNPGLPGSQRILADHAGTGRSAQRLQGHHLRARRGARAQKSAHQSAEQGSLFGDQPDGQAA